MGERRFTDEELRAALAEAGRRAVLRRRKVPGACTVCGKPFTGYPGKLYCSSACNVRAFRIRQRKPVRPVDREDARDMESVKRALASDDRVPWSGDL